jgi:hypothetical protein
LRRNHVENNPSTYSQAFISKDRNCQRYNNRSEESDDEEEGTQDTWFKNPCCKHNKQHEWKDCTDNPANKNHTERGEVGSMETSEKKKMSFVRFKSNVEEIEPDNESDKEDESKTSLGELWAIDAKTKIKIESNLEKA